ncbi:hypothetical protein EROM_041600 [Encephalitozoon romaleae SJ-2008]|uniref:Uncharacterized protein n=1 Tax=Encephalitozoon romaleae (strain SJ-2008) TaxID=1178016 RepID=I7AMI7_ENCRO|nr:hypothetical protein EROM_041600 [Encephalitozoon romaleae SJ-2008]AFN82924.1 hypothetical protein EROM_041600 [Encephalitozoon romaleae SJ-2008]
MERKLPTVVTIGGRRYVKNNLNKGAGDGKVRLKEAIKSLGRLVHKSQISYCSINTKERLQIYRLDDSKVILNKKNGVVGFIVTGKAQNIDKGIYREPSNVVNSNVEASGDGAAEEREKS